MTESLLLAKGSFSQLKIMDLITKTMMKKLIEKNEELKHLLEDIYEQA